MACFAPARVPRSGTSLAEIALRAPAVYVCRWSPPPGATRIVTPVYYDYAARLDWNGKQHGQLGLFTIGSSDTLHVLDADPNSNVTTDLNTAVTFLR